MKLSMREATRRGAARRDAMERRDRANMSLRAFCAANQIREDLLEFQVHK